jgi:hypothetical protein
MYMSPGALVNALPILPQLYQDLLEKIIPGGASTGIQPADLIQQSLVLFNVFFELFLRIRLLQTAMIKLTVRVYEIS